MKPLYSIISIVNEFQKVQLNDLPIIHIERETYFIVDLLPNTQHIFVAFYCMEQKNMKQLKDQLKDIYLRVLLYRVSLNGVVQSCLFEGRIVSFECLLTIKNKIGPNYRIRIIFKGLFFFINSEVKISFQRSIFDQGIINYN